MSNKTRQLLTGNEAIARGAYEAGVTVCSAYPGTPSTEIFENLAQYKDSIYAEWAPNEKVATEVAYGACIANARSLTAMKHVGLNVAADLVFTAAYNGVGAGFVIVTADDPDMHSSQNEQDNRRYAQFAKIPLIEPADSQECKDFMKEAYHISERFDIPVLFRTTTRVSHSKSLVTFGEREEQSPARYVRNIPKFVCTPAFARKHRPELEEKLKALEAYANTSPLNSMELGGGKIGVLSASIAYQYAKEVFPANASFLKLGFTWPLPMDLIRTFASNVETLYVVEELEPFMEEQLKAAGIACIGKQVIPPMFELNPEIVRRGIFGTEPEVAKLNLDMVPRPPALCPGCPHRGFFYVLSKRKDFVITGDIGCYTLGYAAPLSAMDTCACMGGGFSLGMGMAKAFAQQGITDKKIFGVVGDSTFFHSGLTGAVEILYNKGNMIPCVLDNSITGMTGHQDNPGTGFTLKGEIASKIAIEDVFKSFGYGNVIIVDPQDLKAMQKAVDDALASTVPAAIIARRPCILIKRLKHDVGKCQVDRDKCRGCKVCLKVACPALHMTDGKTEIDQTLCAGCQVCAQACPFGAISRLDEQKGE
ncbi:MAG: indolepyruvate ferredoxin oxidoreductase subunit alpha [Eubacteriales bacterium]|nr:indolepyruvate ferredoxin oxidoreductase subunit alpha [Eubacteriales bacterium]